MSRHGSPLAGRHEQKQERIPLLRKKPIGIQRYIIERMLVLIVFFFLIGSLLIVLRVQPDLVEKARSRNAWIADFASQTVQAEVTRSADLLMGLGAAISIHADLERDDAFVTGALDNAVAASQLMISATVLHADGTVAYADSTKRAWLGMDMTRMPWYPAVPGRDAVTWSPVYLSASTGEAAVSCLYALNGWLLQAELDLRALNSLVKEMDMPTGMHIDILDEANRMIVGHSMDDVLQRVTMGHLPVEGFSRERGGYAFSHDGTGYLAEYERLDNPPWVVMVIAERDSVLDMSRRILVGIGGLFVLLVLSVMAMTWRTHRIWVTAYGNVRQDLHRMVERIDRGEASGRDAQVIGVRFNNFDGLMRDFYQMAESLRLAEEEARQKAEEAERSDQAKSRFIRSMSREFKNPLGGVLGATDLLLFREADPEKRECLRMLRGSAEVLQRMTSDVLAVAELDAGTYQIADKPMRVQAILEETVRAFSDAAMRKGLDLSMRWDRLIPPVLRGDEIRIRQILNQLTDNAIRFTREGVVRLSARFIDMSADRAVIQFQVTDTGAGITPERQEHLFEDFYAAQHPPQPGAPTGAGLGLPLVRRLLDALGGTMEVESKPDHGSTFRFSLTLLVEEAYHE